MRSNEKITSFSCNDLNERDSIHRNQQQQRQTATLYAQLPINATNAPGTADGQMSVLSARQHNKTETTPIIPQLLHLHFYFILFYKSFSLSLSLSLSLTDDI